MIDNFRFICIFKPLYLEYFTFYYKTYFIIASGFLPCRYKMYNMMTHQLYLKLDRYTYSILSHRQPTKTPSWCDKFRMTCSPSSTGMSYLPSSSVNVIYSHQHCYNMLMHTKDCKRIKKINVNLLNNSRLLYTSKFTIPVLNNWDIHQSVEKRLLVQQSDTVLLESEVLSSFCLN